MALFTAVLTFYLLFHWQTRANRPSVDFVFIGKFISISATIAGYLLFAVLYGSSLCWSMLFKVILHVC